MIRFEDVVEKVRGYNPDADLELLRRAYVFSAFEHKGQVRHSGEPYMVHPLEVADFLADMRLDVVAVAAGLLHDVVEDTLTTIERIEELFGPEVAHVVEGVTKISTIPFSSSEERQAENFRKMLLAMVDDIRVIIVKLADRLHNMRTLHHLPEERRIKIAQETLDIYAPIANRLGMSLVKNELEELCFKYLEPKAYESLRSRVAARRRASESHIDELEGHDCRQARRGASGLYAHRRPDQAPLQHLAEAEQTEDRPRSGVRLRRAADPDQVGEGLLRRARHHPQHLVAGAGPHQGLHRDAAGPTGTSRCTPRSSAKRGAPFEVQIRTEEMHAQAEEGIAAHWKYKEGRVGDQRDERYFQWMRQLLEWQTEVRDPQEFINNLKIDLYPEEVYIFTPKGEVKALPKGATPLDFAYAIHTDVGHRCVGARVNGKMVPLRTRLKNGDIVEIVTQASHTPSRDWLNFVVTSRARQKIRHFVQQEEKARSIELGRKLFDKEARRFNLNPKTLVETDAFRKVADEYGGGKADELMAAIGYGKLPPRTILSKLVPADQLQEKAPDGRVVSAVKRVLRVGEDRIKVSGVDDLLVYRARCCNPIRGEKIVGYISRGKGVAVHSASCPNVVNLLFDPERRIEVEWERGTEEARYVVRLTMQVEDRRGILADVSAKVADINTNITSVEATTDQDKGGRIDMTVEISDVKHLEKVVKSLKSVQGVIGVERTIAR